MLNNAAADVLFSDTQLYENMNRLVKMLSYNPHGYLTSAAEFNLTFNNIDDDFNADYCIIPRFTAIDTGKTDKDGNSIKYSFIDDYKFNLYTYTSGSKKHTSIITPRFLPKLYNGEFKKYDTTFKATSFPYETFVIAGLNPDNLLSTIYVDHNNFHVYVEHINESNGKSEYTEWSKVENLILESAYNDTHYEIRLDENKNYVLKFGDNVHGKMLNSR
jgi:hypothetical protein